MTTYLWLKLVHILAAITAIGTNMTYFVWLVALRGSDQYAAYVLNGIRRLDARLANPAYGVLPVTGILMVLDGDLGLTTFWIAAALVLYAALGVLAGLFFAPALRSQIDLAERGSLQDAAYERAARRTALAGGTTMVPIVAILYVMVMKPSP